MNDTVFGVDERTINRYESILGLPRSIVGFDFDTLVTNQSEIVLHRTETCRGRNAYAGEHILGVGTIVVERKRQAECTEIETYVIIFLLLPHQTWVRHGVEVSSGKTFVGHTCIITIGGNSLVGGKVLITGETNAATNLQQLEPLGTLEQRLIVNIPTQAHRPTVGPSFV